MRKSIVFSMAALLIGACGGGGGQPSGSADMIIEGGMIYTANDESPTAEAVAVRGGKIIYVGDAAGAAALRGENTQLVNLNGAAMYPGFTDAHAHLYDVGYRETVLNLEGLTSLTAVKEKLAERVAVSDAGQLIMGIGWIETHWPEQRFPTRQDLDEVAPNNPVVLSRADGHALVANSMAIRAANVTRDTEIPFGGDILKDAEGEPTGMFIDRAQDLLSGVLAGEELSDSRLRAQKENTYKLASDVYTAYGWTNMHAMSFNPDDISLVEKMSDESDIDIRVYVSVDGDHPEAVTLLNQGQRESTKGRVITRAIKLYMDGALGSRGAALLEPYSDAEGAGLLVVQKDFMIPMLEAALRAGIQMNTHAIGDRGNRLLLDWYEEAMTSVPKEEWAIDEPRWRDEHSQIIDPADIPRFNQLGVIPSMQPSHAIGDLYFAPDRLGKDRLVGAYPWRSLIDSGVVIAGGSDAPVERGDPRIEFYAAVARQSVTGFSNEDWHREQAVSREEALKMFTAWPAYASFQEDVLGTIEVGKFADFTVFAGDIMTIEPADILTTPVAMTIVEGKIVYDNPDID